MPPVGREEKHVSFANFDSDMSSLLKVREFVVVNMG